MQQPEAGSAANARNRWPREETLALLEIRSEMDAAFGDSSHKGVLWAEVSRKMAEKGFQRSSKKCREKFDNLYKYHQRIKEGRSSGKAYQFSDQLEALQISNPSANQQLVAIPNASSSSTSSDEETARIRSKSKRKWKDFFEKLTEDVMKKQEELHRKFMEEVDRRENARRLRDELWKAKETARLNQEREMLNQERAIASAKQAEIISYLQTLSGHHQIPPAILQPQPPATTPATRLRWPKEEIEALIKLRVNMEHSFQQEGVVKGPLWEEISGSMKTMGYNRNAKRCKEKWENINKYYRRAKEKNKKPRVDSKTCSYYYQLEALYSGANPPAEATAENDGEDCDDDDEEEGEYEISAATV